MKINIKDAFISKIEGVESDSSTDETYHHITIIIHAKRVNVDDFKSVPSKGEVNLDIV